MGQLFYFAAIRQPEMQIPANREQKNRLFSLFIFRFALN
jgi:hypothetical protein